MRQRYRQLDEKLQTIRFDQILPGFHRYEFALYTHKTICFEREERPWDDRFRGNTAICYEGRFIAIWDLENDDCPDSDCLCANLVHEMFHAFGLEHGERRFPDELNACALEDDAHFYGIRMAESRMLAKAADLHLDVCQRRTLLAEFCALRADRMRQYPDLTQYEAQIETVEGMAEYAGLCALRALAPEKYRAQVTQMRRRLAAAHTQLDLRRSCYESGALFLMAAAQAGLDLGRLLVDLDQTVFALLSAQLPRMTPAKITPDQACMQLFYERSAKRAQMIRELLDRASAHEGDFSICGYDPMNQFQCGCYLYGTHFFALRDQRTQTVFYLEGPSVLRRTVGVGNRISAWYRPNQS